MNKDAIISHKLSAHIFTYWEPKECMPYYIQLCIETWKKFLPDFPITILDNSNLKDYIDINIYGSELFGGNFTLQQIADAVRVMVLKEHGGIWLDADTLILNKSAADYFSVREDKELMFFGFPRKKGVQLAVIQANAASTRCMRLWVEYIKDKVQNFNPTQKDFWAYLGNSFINVYSKAFPEEIKIFEREEVMPHLGSSASEYDAYRDFFFLQKKHLVDIKASMILLQNSWTPKVFLNMNRDQLMGCNCTLANIIMEVLELDRSGASEFTSFHRDKYKQIRHLLNRTLRIPENKFAI